MSTENGCLEITPETPTKTPASFVIDADRIQRLLDNGEEEKRWDKCSIYRVPSHLVLRNEKVYKPKLVSIGPYHHGEAHLTGPMEEHKHRALCRFLRRSNRTVDDFKEALKSIVGQLMDSYEELDEEWRADEDRFLELMILDGCFVLEILRVFTFDKSLGYSPSDPVFGNRGRSTVTNNLVREFLMLENQLPLLVLEKLLAVENRTTEDPGMYMESLLSIVGEELGPEGNPAPKLHIVDLLRNKIAGKPSSTDLPEFQSLGIESATTYAKAGITFKKSDTNFLSDIKLDKKRVLHLPVFTLFAFTETIWFNVWAFECLHTGLTQDVSTYICVMARLLRSAEDVRLLRSRGLFAITTFGENDEVVELFRALYGNIDYRVSGDLLRVVEELGDCHRRSTRKWRRRVREWGLNLQNTYFKSPWTVLSLIAAALLIALTICQTVFSTLTYYNGE
ncbi:hypothetical protein H6P81_014658 [Aristolochia fimbriata]|uniref:Uncharacterized protein n=1 Tax=Aristolochia fimbriata TaxID=158543 RepID=A0AAV7E3A6_ARIFI|nr:hypothetical protein H6P81_014658 [Aristolochia fimbriata]